MRERDDFFRMTFQIQNSKLQIPNKLQYPISNDQIEIVWNLVLW